MIDILISDNIILDAKVYDKKSAIELSGKLLMMTGYVQQEYITAMFERELSVKTYIGNFIAIPHGTNDSKKYIKKSGISILQIPNGVNYGDGNIAKLVFGIAGKNNEHLSILSRIAIVCSDKDNVDKIVRAKSKEEIISFFKENL